MNRMSSRVKVKVISSIVGIVVLFIVSTMYLRTLWEHVGSDMFAMPQPYVAFVLIVLSVVFTMVIVLKNNGFKTMLNGEYEEYYQEFCDRLEALTFSVKAKNEIKDEVQLLLCDLQRDERPIDQSLGEDFLKYMTEAYGKGNSFLMDMLTGIQYFVFYILLIHLLKYFEQGQSFFEVKIDVSLVFFFFIMSFIAVPLIFKVRRKPFSKRWGHYRYMMAAITSLMVAYAFILMVEILESHFGTIPLVDFFLNGEIICIRNILTLIISFALVLLIQWKKKKDS